MGLHEFIAKDWTTICFVFSMTLELLQVARSLRNVGLREPMKLRMLL